MELVYWIIAYIVGSFVTAYFVARLMGHDLAQEGSGNLGARNAGRQLGAWAFFVVMIGDGLKGMLVVVAGHQLHFSSFAVAVALLCVVMGHIFPFWLRYKGGKGVATAIGGLIVYIPTGVIWLVVGFLLVFIMTRSSTKGLFGAFSVYGMYMIWSSSWQFAELVIIVVMLIVIWANRQNIIERVS